MRCWALVFAWLIYHLAWWFYGFFIACLFNRCWIRWTSKQSLLVKGVKSEWLKVNIYIIQKKEIKIFLVPPNTSPWMGNDYLVPTHHPSKFKPILSRITGHTVFFIYWFFCDGFYRVVSRGLLVQRMTYKDRYVLVFFFSLDLYFLLHNDGTGGLCKYIFLHVFTVEQCLAVLANIFFW